MAEQIQKQNENEVNVTEVDPWEAAFAALDKEESKTIEEAADTTEDGSSDANANIVDKGTDTTDVEEGNDDGSQVVVGEPGNIGGADSISNDVDFDSDLHITEEEIESYKTNLMDSIEQQTVRDVANAYIKQGARHNNGKLGATINDSDICKRDADGVPRFYNPETGREFTGDNPRRQAQEWVDDYNRALAEAFNKTCEGYSKKLLDEQGVGLAVIEFAPKYEQLDEVRRSMFDSIIEDYEIKDSNGDVIGYSCNLDQALSAVNRQVRIIQERFSRKQEQQETKPTGPALDIPAGSKGMTGEKPDFKSLAEAMEWEQNQILSKMKGGN